MIIHFRHRVKDLDKESEKIQEFYKEKNNHYVGASLFRI